MLVRRSTYLYNYGKIESLSLLHYSLFMKILLWYLLGHSCCDKFYCIYIVYHVVEKSIGISQVFLTYHYCKVLLASLDEIIICMKKRMTHSRERTWRWVWFGVADGFRTRNILIHSQTLCH